MFYSKPTHSTSISEPLTKHNTSPLNFFEEPSESDLDLRSQEIAAKSLPSFTLEKGDIINPCPSSKEAAPFFDSDDLIYSNDDKRSSDYFEPSVHKHYLSTPYPLSLKTSLEESQVSQKVEEIRSKQLTTPQDQRNDRKDIENISNATEEELFFYSPDLSMADKFFDFSDEKYQSFDQNKDFYSSPLPLSSLNKKEDIMDLWPSSEDELSMPCSSYPLIEQETSLHIDKSPDLNDERYQSFDQNKDFHLSPLPLSSPNKEEEITDLWLCSEDELSIPCSSHSLIEQETSRLLEPKNDKEKTDKPQPPIIRECNLSRREYDLYKKRIYQAAKREDERETLREAQAINKKISLGVHITQNEIKILEKAKIIQDKKIRRPGKERLQRQLENNPFLAQEISAESQQPKQTSLKGDQLGKFSQNPIPKPSELPLVCTFNLPAEGQDSLSKAPEEIASLITNPLEKAEISNLEDKPNPTCKKESKRKVQKPIAPTFQFEIQSLETIEQIVEKLKKHEILTQNEKEIVNRIQTSKRIYFDKYKRKPELPKSSFLKRMETLNRLQREKKCKEYLMQQGLLREHSPS